MPRVVEGRAHAEKAPAPFTTTYRLVQRAVGPPQSPVRAYANEYHHRTTGRMPTLSWPCCTLGHECQHWCRAAVRRVQYLQLVPRVLAPNQSHCGVFVRLVLPHVPFKHLPQSQHIDIHRH